MNAKLVQPPSKTLRYQFLVEHEKVRYNVVVHVNEKGKFIDEEISIEGIEIELDHEGGEGEIRAQIVEWIDVNWNSLVSE